MNDILPHWRTYNVRRVVVVTAYEDGEPRDHRALDTYAPRRGVTITEQGREYLRRNQ
jgi:hypothetical protein